MINLGSVLKELLGDNEGLWIAIMTLIDEELIGEDEGGSITHRQDWVIRNKLRKEQRKKLGIE